jgi:hypothetical protein
MSDERPGDYGNSGHGYLPEPGPDDLEVLLLGGEEPELTSAQAERNTELLAALTAAARDSGVVPTFLQLPAAPPAESAALSGAAGAHHAGVCLRMGARTSSGFPLGRIDFLNAVLRLAGAYQLGMSVGESAGPGLPMGYRPVLAYRPSAPGPDARPAAARRPDPPLRARHRVIDLTAQVPVPVDAPLNGSLMVTVVGPVDSDLAGNLARIAVFLDDHRVGCHAASGSMLERTLVLNFVLAVLPNAPVDTDAFAEILRSGLSSDPVWPARFRPTLLDPVATR